MKSVISASLCLAATSCSNRSFMKLRRSSDSVSSIAYSASPFCSWSYLHSTQDCNYTKLSMHPWREQECGHGIALVTQFGGMLNGVQGGYLLDLRSCETVELHTAATLVLHKYSTM